MHLKKTVFAKNIIAEFLPPKKKSNKVIIFLDGMPSLPGGKKQVAMFFSKKGFWFFNPRYRGSWESGGEFLQQEPTVDVFDVIKHLEKSFESIWEKETYKITNPEFYIIGSSFGGPAALFCSQHKKVKKIIALSSVVDWNDAQSSEPLDALYQIIKSCFGEGYRLSKLNFSKLGKQGFYNPVDNQKNIVKDKILMIHAIDDSVVAYPAVQSFAQEMGIKLIYQKRGGHLSSKILMNYWMWKKVKRFFASA